MKLKRSYMIKVIDNDADDCNLYIAPAELVKASYRKAGPDDPYKETVLEVIGILKEYNPDFGDDKICECGHTYYRHFDSWEGMAPVGCKYCGCDEFKLKKD